MGRNLIIHSVVEILTRWSLAEDVIDAMHLNESQCITPVQAFCEGFLIKKSIVLVATLSLSIFLQEVKAAGLLWSAFSFVNQ